MSLSAEELALIERMAEELRTLKRTVSELERREGGVPATPANGQLLIGNGSGFSLATLTGTANRITVANGAGTITLSGPQDLHSGADPTFDGLNVGTATGAAAGKVKASGDVFALDKGKGLQAQLLDFNVVQASGIVTLTTAFQDMTGVTATFTPNVAETVYLMLVLHADYSTGTAACNAGDSIQCQLMIDGVGQTPLMGCTAPGATGNGTMPGWYKFNLTAAAHTIKMQVRNVTGARGTCRLNNQMTYWRVAQ